MLALYKANCGLLRPIEIIEIDLIENIIHFVFVRCFRHSYDTLDKVIAYRSELVDKQWE